MTYEVYLARLNDYYHLLDNVQGRNKTILKQMYQYVADAYEAGVIDDKEASYDIAGTLQYLSETDEPFDSIAWGAGELELPDGHISGDPEARFRIMLQTIRSL